MAKDKDTAAPVEEKNEKEVVAKNDAYTGMLALSLVALLIGCVLLFLDYQNYGEKPKTVRQYQQQMNVPEEQPQQPQPQQPPVVQPGQNPQAPPKGNVPPNPKGQPPQPKQGNP